MERDLGAAQLATTYGHGQLRRSAHPLWEAASYYATIQTADIDGDGKSELLARGVSGMRTWHLVDGKWATVVVRDGYPDLSFPMIGQTAAYEALGSWLGLKPSEVKLGVRLNSDTGYGNPKVSAADNMAQWGTGNDSWLDRLEGQCQGSNPKNPPQYTTCKIPSKIIAPKFTQDEWTIVSNQIIAELYLVTQSLENYYYGDPQGVITQLNTLFPDDQATINAILKEMEFDQIKNRGTETNYAALAANIIKTVGAIGAIAGPEVAIPLSITGNIIGTVAAVSFPGGGTSTRFAETVEEAWNALAAGHGQRVKHAIGQLDFIRTDLTMLTLIGNWMTNQSGQDGLWVGSPNAYKGAAQKGFATWVYQLFLPQFWHLFTVTNCVDREDNPDGNCFPPKNGNYMAKYQFIADGRMNFTGLLPNSNIGTNSPCDSSGICGWFNEPNPVLVEQLWNEPGDQCSWGPKNQDHFWTYGCPLGLPTGQAAPESDIFNNVNGWNFPPWVGDPERVWVAGRVPVEFEGGGHLRADIAALPGDLDLSIASVFIDRVLYEKGGNGELARGPTGDPLDRQALWATKVRPARAVFETWPGEEPRMRLKLQKRKGQLEATLKVDKVIAHEPALCAGLTPSTELWLGLTLDDGFNPPLPLQAVATWECREKPNGDQQLRSR